MSRSYKKSPFLKDRASVSNDRFNPKTFANRAVRRYEEVPGGKSGFKKIYCSWDISDYRFKGQQNEAELKRQWDNGDPWLHNTYKGYKEALFDWRKWYRRK